MSDRVFDKPLYLKEDLCRSIPICVEPFQFCVEAFQFVSKHSNFVSKHSNLCPSIPICAEAFQFCVQAFQFWDNVSKAGFRICLCSVRLKLTYNIQCNFCFKPPCSLKFLREVQEKSRVILLFTSSLECNSRFKERLKNVLCTKCRNILKMNITKIIFLRFFKFALFSCFFLQNTLVDFKIEN